MTPKDEFYLNFFRRMFGSSGSEPYGTPLPPPPEPAPQNSYEISFGDLLESLYGPKPELEKIKNLTYDYTYSRSIGKDPSATLKDIATASKDAIAKGFSEEAVREYANKGQTWANNSYKTWNEQRLNYVANLPTSWDPNNPPEAIKSGFDGVDYDEARFGGFKKGSDGYNALYNLVHDAGNLIYASTGLSGYNRPWTGQGVDYYQNLINQHVQNALAAGVPQAEIERIYNIGVESGKHHVSTPSGFDSLLSSIGSVVNPIKRAFNIALPVVTTVVSGGIAGPAGLGLSGVATGAVTGAVSGGITAALTGKDIAESSIKGGLLGGVGSAIAPVTQDISKAVSEGVGGGTLGQVAGQAVSGAAKSGIGALVTGQDPIEAALRGGIASGVTSGVGAMGSEYLEDLPKPLQSAITSAVASEILGGDPEKAAINALLKTAPAYAGDVARRPDTGEEGFFAPGGEGYESWGKEEHVFDPTFEGTLPIEEPVTPLIPQDIFPPEAGMDVVQPVAMPSPVEETQIPVSQEMDFGQPSSFVPEEFFKPEDYALEVEPLPFDDTFIRETESPIQTFFPEFEEPFIPLDTGPGGMDIREERIQDYLPFDYETGPGGTDIREERVQDYLPFNYETGPGGTDIREEQTQDYLPYVDTGPGPGGTDVREERFGDYVEGDISDPRNYPRSEPAAQSGNNTAALLAMLASMGFKEDENALAPYQVAQIPVKSPFGLMYGMDENGPYGMRG